MIIVINKRLEFLQNVEDWFNVIPQQWRMKWGMTRQMEQWILKEHKHRWNNEVYKQTVIHITAVEDQEDTLDYDRMYIELLIRLLIIDFEELSMTGAVTDELAIERIIQHYERMDEVLNGINAYTKWLKNYEAKNTTENTEIDLIEREDLLRRFFLQLPWKTYSHKEDTDEDSDDNDEDEDPLFLFLIKLNDEEMKEEEQCWPDYFKNHKGIYQPDFVGSYCQGVVDQP